MEDHRLRTLALAQHGLVTRRQVLELAGTDDDIRHRIRTGQWRRARRGVLVVGAAPHTWEQDVMAASLAAGPPAVGGLRTGLRLWGLVARSGRIQLVTERAHRAALASVEVVTTTALPDVDRAVIAGIPVTSLARTLVDNAPGQTSRVLGGWIDDATRRLGLDLSDLRRCAERLAVPGRPAPSELRVALALRDPAFQPGDSRLESEALLAIARAGLPLPVAQHRVVRPDGTPAFIDLAYPGSWVAIELDGYEPHSGRTAFDRDRARGNDLVLLGWRVLRFTSTTSEATFVRTLRAMLAG